MKPLCILVVLLISTPLSISAHANQSQDLHLVDAGQVLHDHNSASNLTPNSHAHQNPAVKNINTNQADEAWEGVTYIIENKIATNLNDIPYINYRFD